MNNMKVNEEFLLDKDGKKLILVMDFKAIYELENRWGHMNALSIFNELLNKESTQFTRSVLEILSCCCTNRKLNGEELAKSITPHFDNLRKIDEISVKLLLGFLGESEKGKKKEPVKKNKGK